VAEHILNSGLGDAEQQRVFDELFEGFADDAGEHGGPDHEHEKALKGAEVAEVSLFPGAPEVGNDGEHGAGVQHDEQERHLG
jgi:hypothetical protein